MSLRQTLCLVPILCLGAFASSKSAVAQCVLPHQLTNGQPADATQVMANYNALLDCVNAAAPAGPPNAIQYHAGSGAMGGVGPLGDGQLVIGSMGNPPQVGTLTAGTGISIDTAPGGIVISATGIGGANGLYNQVLSLTPTSAGTGLTTWLNQGSAVVSDSLAGMSIDAPSHSGVSVVGRYKTAPTPPYKITVLIAATRNNTLSGGVGIGWYNGTNRLHLLVYRNNNGGGAQFLVGKWTSFSVYNSADLTSATNGFAQPVWLQIADDGTNVSFAFSQDGANFLPLFTTAKSSSWLGATGYNNIIFANNAHGGRAMGTLMSWKQE
jgi:hypothetical protein